MNREIRVDVDVAKAALALSGETKRQALLLLRPPMWLNGLISVLAASATIASAQASHSSLWTFIALGTSAVLLALVLGWCCYLKLSGVSVKSPLGYSPKSTTRNLALALFSAFTVLLGYHLTQQGNWQFAYLAGLLIGILSGVGLYKLPTGEWIPQDRGNE
ncbi:hypothetical protein [Pseudoalteromonas sp. OOF1S-7]|uniref:hypothetical protein n=1 Tax=Pseudoalteromonas sp. OOF1S-7 TaxID=2917757 RepID=UPI001EF44BD1|nr:hypothetical protein [Pseudoalteromonas sp. OOF1S-7]MCG7534929.1 hypothetical protein [Pseudoalteromonas sp. OOF1S-7]